MIKEAINKVTLREDLKAEEMREVMREILSKMATPSQVASFITALRMKGETIDEITSAAEVFRGKISKVSCKEDVISIDREEITVERETIIKTTNNIRGGTNIFNISTATAFVIAAGGLKIAKTVRKSFQPLCGCADVVEALGIDLELTRTQLERALNEIGICFIYEPLIQNGLEHIISIRRGIGIRTIFNLIDPLINPAEAKFQLLGVYEPDLTEKMAFVLKNLGIKKGLVFYGEDTLDEISVTGKTRVTEIHGDELKNYIIVPEDFGIKRANVEDLKGGTKQENAKIILEILNGQKGAKLDVTILNAAGAFYITGKVKSFGEGVELARDSIESGKAMKKFRELIEFNKKEHTYFRTLFEDEYRYITK